MNNVSVRQTLKQPSQETSSVVCAPSPASPTLPTHTHFCWTGHFQARELQLLNKSPLRSHIFEDRIERTNFEKNSLKSCKNASHTLGLGDISLNFR